MNVAASGRTWEEASSPTALRLTRDYEEAWEQARRGGRRLDPAEYLSSLQGEGDQAGARLAVLRSDLGLRWEAGDRVEAKWYLERFPDLGDDSKVALIYEEFCLREDGRQQPSVEEFLTRYAALAEPLRRVLEIHQLIGSSTASHSVLLSGSGSRTSWPLRSGSATPIPFPEAGQTIGGFLLVEELGRGAFGRVFLARERKLADRRVALKVTRRGSREPQALARLQHTHIVPVHSHLVDEATRLHLLCMPYFGRITLSRVLAEVEADDRERTGATLVDILDRLSGDRDHGSATPHSGCRDELSRRSYAQAIAWWGARLAEALEHAHDRGVLHRDIKPSNVLVIEDGMPMLLDFNLARESVADEPEEGGRTLGGTVDYMAPEHLEALAEGIADGVDRRSDVYGMGVLLFEAVAGKKPFRAPAKARSMIDALNRLAAERRWDPSRLFRGVEGLPASLRAVILRCLQGDPEDRYQTAAQLAADLHAVADDLPLVHAREPFVSRSGRRLRRSRRGIAAAVLVLAAVTSVAGAYLSTRFDDLDRFQELWSLYNEGAAAIDRNEFKGAIILLDNALQRAKQQEPIAGRNLLQWSTLRDFPAKLSKKIGLLWADQGLEDLQDRIRLKAEMAKVIGTTRDQADDLFARSDELRFRLLGMSSDLPGAVAELKQRLEPFYVLKSKLDWDKLQHIWEILDEVRAKRLREEVNELLFLWMAGVESSFHAGSSSPVGTHDQRDPALVSAALEVCDRVLKFAEPKEPWKALRALLRKHAEPQPAASTPLAGTLQPRAAETGLLPGEPGEIATQTSARLCFQWGALNESHDRRDRAIEWLQRAVWLEWPNYWYQFYLGYLEDKSGLHDEALAHYSAAVVRLPKSAWLRFSRARVYRIKGRWNWALDDLKYALALMGDAPEAVRVRLEIGVLYQAVGNFPEAEREYHELIASQPNSDSAWGARLNLANIAAESGRETEALQAYESLLKERPETVSARFSRALLNMKLERPEVALADLNRLVQDGAEISQLRPGEIVATRALANLAAGHREAAAEDMALAMRKWPSPANERLRQRTLLAAGRYDELQLQRPDEVRQMPVGGRRLTGDLRAAATALAGRAGKDEPTRFRALISRSLILSALNQHEDALRVAADVLAMAPLSPQARLNRARLRMEAGDPRGARSDVEEGLRLRPDDAGLRELLGVLLADAGYREAALTELDQAIIQAPSAQAYTARAAILEASGQHDRAVYDWSLALQRDPTMASAYLGRARCFVALRIWERALADLEQAATWAGSDLRLQSSILVAYVPCLREHPEYRSRFRLLLGRTCQQAWGQFNLGKSPQRTTANH